MIVNPQDVKALLRRDKVFGMIHKLYGAPPNWSRPQGFVSLSKIILEQQVSLASANAHFVKLNTYIKDFTPGQILTLTDEEMRACQISRQKAKYLRELSTAIINGSLDLDALPNLSEGEIRHQLTSIKGIGHWTTDVYMMFCLQAKDIFPIGDIALVNTVKELAGVMDREAILSHAERWKSYRSLATYYMWHYYLRKRGRPDSY